MRSDSTPRANIAATTVVHTRPVRKYLSNAEFELGIPVKRPGANCVNKSRPWTQRLETRQSTKRPESEAKVTAERFVAFNSGTEGGRSLVDHLHRRSIRARPATGAKRSFPWRLTSSSTSQTQECANARANLQFFLMKINDECHSRFRNRKRNSQDRRSFLRLTIIPS